MRRLNRCLVVFAVLVFAGAHAGAEETLRIPAGYRPHVWKLARGYVDWAEGAVVSEGQSTCRTDRAQDKAMAQKAALNNASVQATRICNGLQIDRHQRFEDLRDSDVHLDIVVGKHTNAAVEWTGEPPALVCRLHLVVPIWGEKGISSIVAEDQRVRAKSAARMAVAQPRVDDPPPKDAILIDARETPLLPCLFPIVIVPEGRVLYNFDTRQQVHGEVRPVVRYIEVDPAAPPASQPGTQPSDEGPILVRALQAGGNYRTDIVLRRMDAARIANDARAVRLLKEGRVFVIVDPLRGPPPQPGSAPAATSQTAAPSPKAP